MSNCAVSHAQLASGDLTDLATRGDPGRVRVRHHIAGRAHPPLIERDHPTRRGGIAVDLYEHRDVLAPPAPENEIP
jgi:hypothetical protein